MGRWGQSGGRKSGEMEAVKEQASHKGQRQHHRIEAKTVGVLLDFMHLRSDFGGLSVPEFGYPSRSKSTKQESNPESSDLLPHGVSLDRNSDCDLLRPLRRFRWGISRNPMGRHCTGFGGVIGFRIAIEHRIFSFPIRLLPVLDRVHSRRCFRCRITIRSRLRCFGWLRTRNRYRFLVLTSPDSTC